MERRAEQNSYKQLFLAGLETEQGEETVLEHVVVESLQIWKKHGKGYEWNCVTASSSPFRSSFTPLRGVSQMLMLWYNS